MEKTLAKDVAVNEEGLKEYIKTGPGEPALPETPDLVEALFFDTKRYDLQGRQI